ncbi:MAG: ATP-binding protein [Deltaproteobacteria bacterium]
MEPRWNGLIDRLERLLDRAERLLEGAGGPVAPDPELFSRHQAFRWERNGRAGRLLPVAHPHRVDLDDLIGIDEAKGILLRNTEQFVAGHPANNVLLWGERGSGKSSCVKGLLPRFAERGLRLVEVAREDLGSLSSIVAPLRGLPYRFLLFVDDLSFGEGEDFRALKSLLDGGVEERPENVRVYATSNRRHLLPEPMSDNTGEAEIHPEEAVAEKLGLADRFGISIGFPRFDQRAYLDAVEHYARRMGLSLSRERLHEEANRFAMERGHRSGRTARQFIDDLAGRLALER